jgi:H+/Cl- antiporter ClcA
MGIKQYLIDLKLNISFIIKCLKISIILGTICGIVGSIFHLSIDYVTQLRMEYPWLVLLLPIGGLCIIFLYHSSDSLDHQPGTNTIIQSVRQQDNVPVLLAPAIFLATVITHLVGGSSGREGAALQIGGSIATGMGRLFQVDKKEMSILIMCGMSAVFSALFGTPLTATLFSMEVVSVGVFYYAAFIPCLCSSLLSLAISHFFGCQAVSYPITQVLTLDFIMFIKLLFFSVFIALCSVLFVLMMHYGHYFFQKYFKNEYSRVIVGSIILLVLTFVFGKNYLGAGSQIIHQAIYGKVESYDFLMKVIFTAVTIGCGFKGGEIVPTFFIGATFGFTISYIFGIDPHIGACLGLVGLFCCVVNCPVTSLFLGIELFGINNLMPMAIIIVFGYVLSGYFSLYHAQKIVYSKTSPEFINKNANYQ